MTQQLMPARRLFGLRNEMDRLFERLWEPEFTEPGAIGEWTPALDLVEDKEGLTLKLDVPGIEPKDIQITLQDQVLTIKGERKQETEEKDERFYRMERTYGTFVRSLRLPVAVDAKKVHASFKNGLLTVRIVKTLAGTGMAIPIETK